MCGISAIISWKNKSVLKFIKPMTDVIRHRGPDDEGFSLFSLRKPDVLLFGGQDSPQELYTSGLNYAPKTGFQAQDGHDLALGHRRLSIIDLSVTGHQPMADPSGRYWVTYNGEVYNYMELKEELIRLGHRFESHSDTEVLIHAYMQWGVECLHKFNGMFAFILYDTQEKVFFGARDRFGVKPLYMWKAPEGFCAFASEIKQFTVLPGWSAKVNGQAAYDFLNYGLTNHLKETMFQGVFHIPGGHYFQCRVEEDAPLRVSAKPWYRLPVGHFKGSLEEAGQQFFHLLKDSVRIRSRADVSIGSCLSGGLDSSTIVCLAHEILKEQGSKHPQMAFSACAHYAKFDEREYMEEVISRTNVKGHFTYPDMAEMWDQLDAIVWHQDEPFATTSIFAQWEVFKLVAKNNVKVMLDGQGADEQLAGYGGFLACRLNDLARGWNLLQLRRELIACRDLHQISFPLKLLFNQILPAWIKQPIRRALKKTVNESVWINNRLLGAERRDPTKIETPTKGELQSLCYAQMTKVNLPMLLHFEDRDSMAHSIEARTPFLDYRLAEFVQSLPAEYKLSDGITKRVLREGLKGTLPEKIRTRISKLGFATPEEVWVRETSPALFQQLVKEAVHSSEGILNDHAVKEADGVIKGSFPYHSLPWRMISFGKWMERFNVRL